VTQSYHHEPFGVIKNFFLNPGLVQGVIWVSASAAGGDRMDDGFFADPVLAARSPSDIPQAGGLVDVATGDVLLVHRDVARPGALPLVVGRVYRSSWRAGRWFGPSWASALDQRLRVTQECVTGVFGDGRMLSWRCTPAQDGPRPVTGLPVTGPRWQLAGGDGDFTVTDPQAGLTWRFERRPGYRWSADQTGELPLVAVTDRAGRQIGYHYTRAGHPAWITHSAGYRVRIVMDGSRVTALALVHGQSGREMTLVRYGYNPAGDLAAVIDAADRALCFGYDEEGRLTGWHAAAGTSCRYRYDRRGRCLAGAGSDGLMSATFTYGDRVTWWTDAAGAVTTYQLDEWSRIAAVTDPRGGVTRLWHDESGRLVVRSDPPGHLTRYSYDDSGRLTTVTRPDGRQARAVYDESGLLVRRDAPDGAVTSYGYDEHGHLASVTGPSGAVTRVECDAAGLPAAVTSPGAGTARYIRDPLGRVTGIIGPNGLEADLARLPFNQPCYFDPVTAGYFSPDPLAPELARNPHAFLARPCFQADPGPGFPDFAPLLSGMPPGIGSDEESGDGNLNGRPAGDAERLRWTNRGTAP